MKKLLVAALCASATGVIAQSMNYYVTDGTSGPGNTHVLSAGTVQFSYAWAADAQMAIVLGDFGSGVRVRQAASQPGSGSPQQGDEYLLDGTPTGFTNTWVSPDPAGTTAYDAGFDGSSIYMVHWLGQTDGQVFRYDNNYANGQFLFQAAIGDLGITYDNASGTIWTSNFGTGAVTNYDLSGNVLSQFQSGSGAAALAYEVSSDTLWLSETSAGLIAQYSKTGTLLDSYTAPAYVLGGEFAMIPEPATVFAIGAGLLALCIRRRIGR
ncbi:MAG: PEP-CTERM sorting domain-containing protein [Armatimonadota bacterium]|nr:PEP-CTERM sorting domain-containing protein [Armatimonadota bacterium]